MNEELGGMISQAQRDTLSDVTALVMKMFFNKLTLNDLIMKTNVKEELRNYKMKHLHSNNRAMIYQKEGERPYFFIYLSEITPPIVEAMFQQQKMEKEVSSNFKFDIEIEGRTETFHIEFDVSSLWITIKSDKLDGVWAKMLEIKGLN